MDKGMYAILRFQKHQGYPAKKIEDHHERNKETYASNPDIDLSRTGDNFHIINPIQRYYAEIEKRISAAQCRTRKDSVRFVDTLVAASPKFFEGKTEGDIRAYYTHACRFLEERIGKQNIISAVVHMDEKTPHMHLVFVPLTSDNRLSAKDIIGNRKQLVAWQDDFWKHMSQRYPQLERGESASETGRTHIPTRLFKEMVRLNGMRDKLMELLAEVTPFNKGKKAAEIENLLKRYIPGVEQMRTKLKKYDGAFKELKKEKEALLKQLDDSKESTVTKLATLQQLSDYEELRHTVEFVPTEILEAAKQMQRINHRQTVETIAKGE